MSEGIFSWLRRAKAQPGSGNLPDVGPEYDAPDGGRKLSSLAAPAVFKASDSDIASLGVPQPIPTSPGSLRDAPAAGLAVPMAAAAGGLTIGDTIAGAAKDSGLKTAEALHPTIRNTLPAVNQTVSQVAGETAALGQQPAQVAQAARNSAAAAKWGPAGSPEAQAFNASRAAPAAAAEVAPAAGRMAGLRAGAGALLRGASPWLAGAAAVPSAIDMAKEAVDGKTSPEATAGSLFGPIGQGVAAAYRSLRGAAQTGGSGPATPDKATPTNNPKVTLAPGLDGAGIIGRNDATGLAPGQGAVRNNSNGQIQTFGGPKIAGTTFLGREGMSPEDQAGFEVARIESQIQANRAAASPEAGGTGISVGGLRGSSASPGIGGKFGGAFDALSQLQGYGAAGRLAKNEADLGLRGEQAKLERAKFGYQIGKDQRDFAASQQKADRESNTKAMSSELESRARIKVGAPGIYKTAGDHKAAVDLEVARMEKVARYGASNRRDGKRYEDLSGTERSQLHDAIKVMDKVIAARETLGQNIKDYFGNPQADSDDPYSYMPARTDGKGKPVAATRDSVTGQIRIQTVNGNTILVKELADGKFNLWGSNNPVDADMLALAKPQIDALKRQEEAAKKAKK